MENEAPVLVFVAILFLFSSFWAFFAYNFFSRRGALSLPSQPWPFPPVPGLAVLGALVAFFLLSTLFGSIGYYLDGGVWTDSLAFFFFSIALTSCLWIGLSIVGVPLFAGGTWRSFLRGAAMWFLAFPCVIASSKLVELLLMLSVGDTGSDQLAVNLLRRSLENPISLGITLFGVVFLAPLSEEILFRGFLQGWLRRHLGPKAAIVLASIIFALFHYSGEQGWTNVSLVVSLSILSIFLGILYEKERSLLAPFGLHAAFNGFSACLIVLFPPA